MRSPQIYIEGNRIELFEDDNIIVNSSVQNISDISKVFTDFSQQFTVPASDLNNRIVQHFYDYDVDGTLDHNLRRSASIEIDHTPFRSGKMQLEKANLIDGQPESYTFTFYGQVVSFKDLIGEDKLNSLDFSDLLFPYTGANVLSRINNATRLDIQYPLISSGRIWQYDNPGVPSLDIKTSAGRMDYRELFPAIRVSKILDKVQLKYGINLSGLILSDSKFQSLYLYCKNKEQVVFQTASEDLNLIITDPLGNGFFNTSANTLKVLYDPNQILQVFHRVKIQLSNISNPNANWRVEVFADDALYAVVTGAGTNYANNFIFITGNDVALNRVFKFRISSDIPLSVIQFNVTYERGNQTYTAKSLNDLTASVNIRDLLPDMKIYDFIAGLFKEFNLTAYGIDANNYVIETLEDFYNKGRVIDITKHTDLDSIDIARTKLFKKINFKHQKSESFMNRSYFDNFTTEYGGVESEYPYDEGEYVIDVPFENLLFNKFPGTQLQVGYNITPAPDSKPYLPKPTLLYLYGSLPCNFKFFDGVSEQTVTSYMAFGQDIVGNGENFSLNFGQDASSLLTTSVYNGIINTYYLQYLTNLYNPKTRITTVKTLLPISILTSLKLNDRLIIRDHRFIINNMKTNITNGECNLVLVNDYRLLRSRLPIRPKKGTLLIQVKILLPNGVISADILPSTEYTPSQYTVTQDSYVEFELEPNPKPISRILREDGSLLLREDAGFILREDSEGEREISIGLTYTYSNGELESDEIIIIQE